MTIDWQTVIIAAIAATPGALFGLAALVQSTLSKMESRKAKEQAVETHMAVNSRMDKFLALLEAQQAVAVDGAKAQATLDEKTAEQARKDANP